MNVLFCASECVPFVKTGGLADVAGSLPKALHTDATKLRVVLPKYRLIPYSYLCSMEHVTDFTVLMGSQSVYCGVDSMVVEGIRYYFIDNLALFGGETVYTGDRQEGYRYAFFCRAVLEMMKRLDYFPDILHCNDWQTGLIPVLLKNQYKQDSRYSHIKTVFTIHNLRYQGLYDWGEMNRVLGLEERLFNSEELEFYGCLSFMKGGIVFADKITTVSPSYADEIQCPYYGERLDGLLRKYSYRLSGILNGIDTELYDPERDPELKVSFSKDNRRGKVTQKAALQQECGLELKADTPLMSMITRLCAQKGLDLVEAVLDDIMRQDIQLLFLAKGEPHYEDFIRYAQRKYPGRVAAKVELNEGLAHRVYAGSDMFLMPSQFEPCGLSQLIALRYGAIPIVRETGGLRDTVIPFNVYTDGGNGFSFASYNAHEMLYTVERACGYYQNKALWQRLTDRAMASDYSWKQSAKAYNKLYNEMMGY